MDHSTDIQNMNPNKIAEWAEKYLVPPFGAVTTSVFAIESEDEATNL